MTVVSPTGTFLVAFPTAEPLAEWADQAIRLPPPVVSTTDLTTTDAEHKWRVSSVLLNELGDSATRFDFTTFKLTRLNGDSTPAYVLTGTNGAWSFGLQVNSTQFVALLAALNGDANPGAVPFETPRVGRTPGTGTPNAMGTWIDLQVDRPTEVLRQPLLIYPPSLVGSGVKGDVTLTFVVGDSGRVLPWSVRLIGKPHPLLAIAAREALFRAVFRPALIGERPVPQLLRQKFEFR